MKKKIGKIVALFMAAGLLVNSFFWSAANEGDNGALDTVQEIQENKETLHSHEWGNETVNTPATCNTDGSATVTCSSCGATEDRTISATGEHNFGDWTLVTAATADTPGEEKRVCNDCGTEETREIPVSDNTDNKLENKLTDNSDGTDNVLSGGTEDNNSDHKHDWVPVEGTEGRTEPTCGVSGKQLYTCSAEGCTETKEEEIPATGKHTVETWTEDKAPTETETGSEYGTCTVCGETVTRTIPALNHEHKYSEKGTVDKAATETEDGKVRYYCTSDDCDSYIEGTSHYYRENEAGEFVCVNCGEKETPDDGNGCGHDWQETETGIFECSKCHSIKDTNTKVVSDNEIKEGENNLLGGVPPCEDGKHVCPASYEVLEKATCKTEGKKRYICDICGTKVTETTPKTDHVWDSKTGKCTVCDTACDHKDGDHTAFDSQTGKCKVCGYQCAHDFGEDNICKVCGFKKCTTHTKPVGSDAVIITVKAATCKTEGLVKYKCTVCGEEVTEKTAVDPDAHDWNSSTGKCKLCDAECEHKDEHEKTLYGTDGKCTVCGHTCEHSFKVITEEGKDDVVQCEVCGYICTHDEKSLVPIKGTGDKDADCKNVGQQTYMCSVCGEEVVKEIPLSGKHHYDESGSCKTCGDELHTKEIGDCEHKDWVDWDNDGTDLDSANPWKYLKTDIDAKKDIFECSKCGSIWERDAVDREEKTVDLTQITKGTLGVTISVNGQEVGDKQEVKINKSDVLDIHIDWAIDNDRKPTSNTTIQYQLPVILKTVPMTGTIWGPGGYEEYGTFSINSSGLLTFKLNDKILKKSEISGSFDLQATLVLSEEGSQDKQEILFPGGAGITVYFKSNMTSKKEAKLNNDGSIDYKVTFELDSDSKNVSLTDTLASNLTFEGYEGSFRLKNTATGAESDITDKVEIDQDKKIAVIDLGDVKKGKYELSYKAKLIDSSVKASSGKNTNTVTWKWDDKKGGPISCKVETTGKPLWKNSVSTTDEEKAQGIYRWEVVINKDIIPVNLSEKTIYDWYETQSGSVPNENTYIVGDITVTDVTTGNPVTGLEIKKKTEGQSWNLADNCLFQIKFPYGDYTHVYKITYTTQTKANDMDGKDWGFVDLRNWAKIVETGDNDYEDALVGKKYTPGILTKAGKAVSNDNSDASEAYKAQWQVKLDLSEFKNGDILKDLKITDTLPDGMTFYDVDESEMNFVLTLSDGTPLSEGTDYKKEITNNKTLLTLTFTEEGQRKCAGKVITMTFTSVADPGKIPMNGSKEYTNNATASFLYNSAWSYKASAKVTMYKKDALSKSGTVLSKKNANGNYEIQWTILVNTNDAANLTPEKAYTGDITVTDTLPDGLTYVDGSATMVTSTRTDWEVKKSQAAAIIPAPEGLPGKLIFTIPGSTYNNAYKITFKTEVDPAKLDKTNLGTTFTNTVVVENNGGKSEAEADVTIAKEDLLKKSGQTTGTHIQYTIDVNANAQQLTSRGVLTLEDEIDNNADILTNTISVKKVDILTQAETDITDSCSISYTGNKLIIGNIPDGTHVRVTYKAVTVRSGDVEVTNSAVLKGEDVLASTVTTGTFKIKASATANGRAGTFTLIKLDSSDARKNLAGAEFTLYKFDMDNIDATPATVATLKTDEDGRVTFGEGTMDELEFDVLFCYVETKAPTGYKLDNTPHYFMLEGNSFASRNQLAIDRIGESADYRTYAQDGSKTRQLSNDPTPPPTPPDNPDTPDEPGTPGTPGTPVTYTAGVTPKVDVLGESKMPDGAMPAAPGIGVLGDMKGPGTGDQTPVIFWTLLVCSAAAVLISCIVFRKKRKK